MASAGDVQRSSEPSDTVLEALTQASDIVQGFESDLVADNLAAGQALARVVKSFAQGQNTATMYNVAG